MASSSSFIHSVVSPAPQRAEFIQAVQDFKKTHAVKLKALFAPDTDDQEIFKLREQFWNNLTIRSYLARSSKTISFTQYHPVFEADRQSKQTNDYYEYRMYRLNPEMLPFRANVMDDKFYQEGVHPDTRLYSLYSVKQENVLVTPQADIYEIRSKLSVIPLFGTGMERFVLSKNGKDDHATAVISILEEGSNRILSSIFINSWKEEEYTRYTKYRFELNGKNGMINFPDSDKALNVYNKLVSEFAGKKYNLDWDKKIGWVIDGTTLSNEDPEYLEMMTAFKEGRIRAVHELKQYRPSLFWCRIFDNQQIPFLDASHDLQTAEGDGNCALYSFNILQAAGDLLADAEVAKRVYDLALQVKDGTDEDKLIAQSSLISIFTEEIKAHLPFYYNADGTQKDEAALKEFHIRQRWDFGSMAIQNRDYLRKMKFLAN